MKPAFGGTRSVTDEIGRQIRSERLVNLVMGWGEVSANDLPRNSGVVIYNTSFDSADVLSWTETKYNAAGQVESTKQGYMDDNDDPQLILAVTTYFYDGKRAAASCPDAFAERGGNGRILTLPPFKSSRVGPSVHYDELRPRHRGCENPGGSKTGRYV